MFTANTENIFVEIYKDFNLLKNGRKYSKVGRWTVGLSGGKDLVAVIRASGSISRVKSPLSTPSSGIIGEKIIEKIQSVRGKTHLRYLCLSWFLYMSN